MPNTILPLALARSYRSGVSVFGPLGWNWDHNFNVYLRELATGDVAVWRKLHEDVFTFDGVRHEPPRGIFELLERQPGPAPRWRSTGARRDRAAVRATAAAGSMASGSRSCASRTGTATRCD